MGSNPRFSGGNIQEYQAQIQNGTLRIDNLPEHFDFEMLYEGGGASPRRRAGSKS
jgi:hypothetical protein